LYNNWTNEFVPTSLRTYLFFAVIVLIFITSMGIFGFLSKAHLDQVKPTSSNNIKIELIDKQISSQQSIIDRSQDTLNLLDSALEKYVDMEYVTRGLKEREKQKEEREVLNNAITNAINEIAKLSESKGTLQLEQDKIEAEVGPIKYIAELIYGDEAEDYFDEAVRWVIIVLIFVFDPLAVLLLIAANISLRTRNHAVNKKKNEKKIDYEKEIQREKDKLAKMRKKQRQYTKFAKKLGVNRVSDLKKNEIKLKVDQILNMNK